MPSSRSVVIVSAIIDVVLLIAFVLIGRASHGEGPLGVLVTLWPFLVGLIVGWLIARAWRTPRRVVWVGLIVWGSTLVIGMVLRAISGGGIEPSFIVVTALVLAAFFLGWRALSSAVIRVLRGS